MSRRIELELTSERADGSWTWRAAGALQPKGELDGALLPSGAKVGDVLRAEADFDIDGITVTSVLPPKGGRNEPERLEVIGPQREFTPVTSTLTGRSDRAERGDRRPRRDRGERGDRPDRGPRPPRGDRPERPDRGPRHERPDADRPRTERPRRERPAPPPPKPKPKKLRPARTHRDALVAGLPPEQQAIAEQLLRGGLPSVRTALEEQNTAAKADGKPEIPVATVLSIAEQLLPKVRVAEWLDRAEAAAADAEEISLRDLRAVVTSADDVARDETTRDLAARLREVLERRSAAEQQEWLADLTSSLQGARVVRALRLSSRPPHPGEGLPEELLTKLAEAASAAMTSDVAPDRWATLLDAVAYSPVRRSVTPAGIPTESSDELLTMVRKHAGRVPAAATMFGIEPPPPKGSKRARPPRAARPSAAAGAAPSPLPPVPPGARRVPPPPRPPGAPPPPPPGPRTPVAPRAPEQPAASGAPSAPEPTPAAAEAAPESSAAPATPTEATPDTAPTPEPTPTTAEAAPETAPESSAAPPAPTERTPDTAPTPEPTPTTAEAAPETAPEATPEPPASADAAPDPAPAPEPTPPTGETPAAAPTTSEPAPAHGEERDQAPTEAATPTEAGRPES